MNCTQNKVNEVNRILHAFRGGSPTPDSSLLFVVQAIELNLVTQNYVLDLLAESAVLLVRMLNEPMISTNARRAAAKLLCAIVDNNESTQLKLCDTFAFTPVGGLVSINPMPKNVAQTLQCDPKQLLAIKKLKNTRTKKREHVATPSFPNYWSFPAYENTHRGLHLEAEEENLSEEFIDERINQDNVDFPDPLEYLIGFYSHESPA